MNSLLRNSRASLKQLVILLALIAPALSQSGVIDNSYFGMTEHNIAANGFPKVPVGILRINNDQALVNVKWLNIETCDGGTNQLSPCYTWGTLDSLVSQYTAAGYDTIYTFANTPNWANAVSCPNDGACPCVSTARVCWPPDNFATTNQAWKDFMTAMTSRYDGNHGHGRIKYWEIWNEPNSQSGGVGQFWYGGGGSNAQKDALAAMHCDAYPIIKAIPGNVVIEAAPQGSSAGTFLGNYLPRAAALPKCSGVGNGIGADIIGFHAYVGSGNLANMETTLSTTMIDSLKTAMAASGLSALPLEDTESGWGIDTTYPDFDLEASFVIRHHVLEWSKGVAHGSWWAWSDDTQGTLYDKVNKVTGQAGVAWQTMYTWLINGQLTSACTATGTVWKCPLTRGDGTQALIMWDSAQTTCTVHGTFTAGGTCNTLQQTVASTYTQYFDINNAPHTIASSHQVPVGIKPVMLTAPATSVSIYPTSFTMPQKTRLPIMCDPAPCTINFVGTAFGTLDSHGTYTAPASPGSVTIQATKGTAHANLTITVSGTLPALSGDTTYANRGTTPNQLTFQHQELSGTAKRYFNVVVPTQINSNTTVVVNTGSTGHGIQNWCAGNSMTQAGNETTGWAPLLLALPLSVPNAVYVCAEGGWRSSTIGTPELQNFPGVGVSAWVSDHNSTTAVVPDEADFIEKVIQYVTRDLNVDARKVMLTNDWRFGEVSYEGIANSPLVSTIAPWADFLGYNLDANFTVLAGAGTFAGQTIQPPTVPVSYFNIASQFAANLNPNLKSMCGVSDGTHTLTVDDSLAFFNRTDAFTGSSTNNKMCLYDAQGNTLYNPNGVGRASAQEFKCLTGGKAGTEACIIKMRVDPVGDQGSVHALPYTAPTDWNGGTAYIVQGATVPLDLRASQQVKPCSSGTPCTSYADAPHGPHGIDTPYMRYLFHLAHGKPDAPIGGGGGGAPVVCLEKSPPTCVAQPSLVFSATLAGMTSPAQNVTLLNSGNATLNISSITVGASFNFDSGTTCVTGSASTLAAGASCVIAISFTPDIAGLISDAVKINDNAAGSPHTINVSGTGQAYDMLQWMLLDPSLRNTNHMEGDKPLNTITVATVALSSNVLTLTGTNSTNVGQFVKLSGFNTNTFLNGKTCTAKVPTNGTTVTCNFTHADVSSHAETGFGIAASNHIYTQLDTNKWWWIKGTSGFPWDEQIYDANLTYLSLTELDFSDPHTGKRFEFGNPPVLTGVPFSKRQMVPGEFVQSTNTSNKIYTSCTASTPHVLGDVQVELHGPFFNVNLGGTLPSNLTTIELWYRWGGQGHTTGIYGTQEEFTFGWDSNTNIHYGQVQWKTRDFNSVTGQYGTPTNHSRFNQVVAGASGLPAVDPCGFAPPAAGSIPTVSLLPGAVNFPTTKIGQTATAIPVTLSNTSTTVNASITAINIQDANSTDFAQTNNCPVGGTLAIGSSCTINVTFSPQASGARQAQLSVLDNAQGSPHTTALTGIGDPCQ